MRAAPAIRKLAVTAGLGQQRPAVCVSGRANDDSGNPAPRLWRRPPTHPALTQHPFRPLAAPPLAPSRRRVKITGLGVVTPAGIGREEFFRGINEPRSRIGTITRFDADAGTFVGAEIHGFDLKNFAPDENPRRMSRHTQFALVAGLLAIRDAGIDPARCAALNPTVVTGTSIMDIDRIGRGIENVVKKGPRHAPGSIIYEASTVNVAGKIAQLFEPTARMLTLQTSCCSGLDAIGQAAELVATGQTQLAIAGGAESPFAYYPMLAFNASELSPSAKDHPERSCRPFDLWRSTGVLGEGAAMLVLEPEDSPRPAFAWLSGYGYANDPEGQTAAGLYEAALHALANARRQPRDIDYVNAWGPGHRLIDNQESFVLKRLFGDRLPDIAVTSLKGAIGTALAASGAIQAASVALTFQHGRLPPTVNWQTPDPNCPLNLSAQPRFLESRVAMVNSHGLSGSNAVVILEKSCPP